MTPHSVGVKHRHLFNAICEDLFQALQKGESVIRLPENPLENILDFANENEENKTIVSSKDSVELISIIDRDPNENICGLFDGNTFVFILQIFMSSEWCRAAERGLYLLTAALYEDKFAVKSPEALAFEEKLIVIGKKSFQSLMEFFVAEGSSSYIRTWVGLLIIVLCKKCQYNRTQLKSTVSKASRRKLGELVMKANELEIVRILDGKMLTVFMEADLEKKDFFPSNSNPSLYHDFPVSQSSNNGWNDGFQNWAARFAAEDCSEPLYNLRALSLTPNVLKGLGKNLVVHLAIISNSEFSIYVQDSQGPDQKLDISLNLICGQPSKKRGASTKEGKYACVVIPFREIAPNSGEKSSSFLNARPLSFSERMEKVEITFETEELADHFLARIAESKVELESLYRSSQGSNKSDESCRPSQAILPLHLNQPPANDDSETESSSSASDDELGEIPKVAKGTPSKEQEEEIATTETVGDRRPDSFWQGSKNTSPRTQIRYPRRTDLADVAYEEGQDSLLSKINRQSKSPSDTSVLRPENITGNIFPNSTAELDKAVNHESPSSGILRRVGEDQSEHRRDSRIVNSTTKKKSDLRKSGSVDRQKKLADQAPVDQIEANPSLPPLKGKSRRRNDGDSPNNTINEAEHDTDSNEQRNLTKNGDTVANASRDSNLLQGVSNAIGRNSANQTAQVSKSQPQTSFFSKKGTEKSASGGRNDEPEPIVHEEQEDSSEPQDASTPKTTRNGALRAQNPSAPDKQDAPSIAKTAIESEGPILLEAKPSKSSLKTYSLKAKPAINVARPVANMTEKRKNVGPNDAQRNPHVKSKDDGTAFSKKPQQKAKLVTHSIKNPRAKSNEKPAMKTCELDVFDLSEVDKDDDEGNKVNRKAPVKNTKSRGSKTPGKTAAKKRATKDKQSVSKSVNDNTVPRRSQREAAAIASSRISKLSSQDDEESGQEEEILARQPAAVEKKLKPSVSKTQTEAREQTPARKSARGQVSSALRAKDGIRTQVEKNDSSKTRTSDDEMNALPDENRGHQQSQPTENAFDPEISHEPLDPVTEQISDTGGPIQAQLQGTDLSSDKQSPLGAGLSEREDRASPALPMISSPHKQSALQSTSVNRDGKASQEKTAQKRRDSMAASEVVKDSDAELTSNRRRLDVGAEGQSAAPKAPQRSGSKESNKLRKADTSPLRRSPRLNTPGTKEPVPLKDAKMRKTIFLVDEQLARKTPIIVFGKHGPKNQGVSSTQRISSSIEREETPIKSQNMEPVSLAQQKRKRDATPEELVDRPPKRIDSEASREPSEQHVLLQNDTPELLEMAKENDMNEQDDKSVGMSDPGTPKSNTPDVNASGTMATPKQATKGEEMGQRSSQVNSGKPVQQPSPSHKSTTKTSTIDDNGSPITSVTSTARAKDLQNFVQRREPKRDYQLGDAELERIPQRMSRSPARFEPVSSNIKARPNAPNSPEDQQYIAHREKGGENYEDIASKKVVHSKQIPDPFVGRKPHREPSELTKRLLASRSQSDEKGFADVPVTPKERSNSKIDKLTDSVMEDVGVTKVKAMQLTKSTEMDVEITQEFEPVQQSSLANLKAHLLDHDGSNIALAQDKLEKGPTSGNDSLKQLKRNKLFVNEIVAGNNVTEEAQPDSRKPTLPSGPIQTQVTQSQEIIMDSPIKRKSDFEVEYQDHRTKRRKISNVQKTLDLDVENARHSEIQNPVEARLSLDEHVARGLAGDVSKNSSCQAQPKEMSAGDPETCGRNGNLDLGGRTRKRAKKLTAMLDAHPLESMANVGLRVRFQKPSFQSVLHRETEEPRKKPSSMIQNRQTHRRAPAEAEVPSQEINSRDFQRRTFRGRPVTKSTRRIRGGGDDPEKTMVEPPPPSSPSSSGDTDSESSDSSHSDSSAASQAAEELWQEEEWGAQLRSHDRPILQSLGRIVNGLVSHLVDQREAVDTIVEDYEEGGTELVDLLETQLQAERDEITSRLESAKAQLIKCYTDALRDIANAEEEEGVEASISDVEKEWREAYEGDAPLRAFGEKYGRKI